MLVSHLHRFVYTKTLKTAGTSVEGYFETYCLEDGGGERPSEYRREVVSAAGIVGARSIDANAKNNTWWNHMPAFQIRQKLGPAVFDAYFKFCCIRNPYDKALSAFFWYDSIGKKGVGNRDLAMPQRLEAWLLGDGMPPDRNKYAINGQYIMDDVIRHETLAADMERICGKVGVAWEPERLPTFKAGIRPEALSFEEMFTPAARAWVAEHYRFELDLFGYGFPAEDVAAL